MATSSRRRPGLPPTDNLAEEVRGVLEPMRDTLSRVVGASIPKLKAPPKLLSTATLPEVIEAYNALVKAHETLLYRIQEE